MPRSVEMSGIALRQSKYLSQSTNSAILLHTQEVAGSNPASRTIAPRRSLEGEVNPDVPKCMKMTVFGYEFGCEEDGEI
jgi:hypothetical protein